LGFIGLFAAGLYAQVVRYRRYSTPTERQQTKWVVYGFALWLVYILLSSVPFFYLTGLPPGAPEPWWASASVLGWFLALNIVPVSLAIAISRHQLWNIDVVINRTLVYGALTASVIGLYALVVGGMGALLHVQGNGVIALIATGLVAVLFQPLRDRLQRGVNRLLYGRRDEPLEVLTRLGQRLQDTLTPELMLPVMVETIAQNLKLPYVAIAVRQGDALQTTESYGKPMGAPRAYPLTYHGAEIGQLLVAQRSADEPFTAAEERLLENIARQAGIAVHALQVTADLQHARQRIVSSREEERRRLRRDLHDGLGPSLAAQLLKVGSARALLADRPEMTEKLLAEMEGDIEDTLAEVRRIVYNLRPAALDQLGLEGALRAYAETCQSGESGAAPTGLSIRVDVPEALPPLPAAIEVAAYHIAREGLTNVVRHAQARHCALRLALDGGEGGRLHLSIHDDGRGLPDELRAGVGLTAMRERAAELGGTCTVQNGTSGGTMVTAVLPLDD
jgi:signal transduction histidine kinase